MQQSRFPVRGAGLGLRRDHLDALEQQVPACINFFEIAPENWIGTDRVSAHRLRALSERFGFVCHGSVHDKNVTN